MKLHLRHPGAARRGLVRCEYRVLQAAGRRDVAMVLAGLLYLGSGMGQAAARLVRNGGLKPSWLVKGGSPRPWIGHDADHSRRAFV